MQTIDDRIGDRAGDNEVQNYPKGKSQYGERNFEAFHLVHIHPFAVERGSNDISAKQPLAVSMLVDVLNRKEVRRA
jgi:hypothetical protein